MKGQFEISEEMLSSLGKHHSLTEMDIVKIMMEQQMRKSGVSENEMMFTGWYARRIDPFTGNRQYLWDTGISRKLSNPKMKEYFRLLKLEGWEIPYKLDL